MIRVFAAVEVPERLHEPLVALAEPIPGVRWRRADQIHLTLHFFGALDEESVTRAGEALAALEVEPFELALAGVGVFPAIHAPRVLWAGVHDGEGLERMHAAARARLATAGFALETRPFRPHVTLSRTTAEVDRGAVIEWLARHARFAAEPFEVDGIVLYASDLSPGGSRYSVLGRYPLRASGS